MEGLCPLRLSCSGPVFHGWDAMDAMDALGTQRLPYPWAQT